MTHKPAMYYKTYINVWCKTDGEKEHRGPNGDVEIEGNTGLDGKGEWSKMVWACVEEV